MKCDCAIWDRTLSKKNLKKKLRSIYLLLLIIIKIRLTKLLILEHISQENLFGGCPNAWLWHVGNRVASNNFPPDVTQRSHDTKIERPEFSLRPCSNFRQFPCLRIPSKRSSTILTWNLFVSTSWIVQAPKVYPRSVQRKTRFHQFACFLVGGLLSCPKTIYHWQSAWARW